MKITSSSVNISGPASQLYETYLVGSAKIFMKYIYSVWILTVKYVSYDWLCKTKIHETNVFCVSLT